MPVHEWVATLVAGQGARLSPAFAQQMLVSVRGSRTDWLADHRAVDIFFTDAADARQSLINLIGDQPIDMIVQPVTHRAKKLLVADMESTIIQQEMLDELAAMIGVGPRVAAITRRAMNGELDFIAALQERVALLKDLPTAILAHAAQKITLMPGARELVGTMKKFKAHTLIVSGGFTVFADKVLEKVAFDGAYANDLLIADDLLLGRVAEPVLDRERKKALLQQICAERQILMAEAVAVGDGANDVPMLITCNEGGGLGVAYHAKPIVRAAVQHHINYTDLTTLLFAQGYRADEFLC